MATAKEEIESFLASQELGVKSSVKKNALVRAAEDMFIAKGEICPVAFVERKGETYIINKGLISDAAVQA